MSTTKTGKVTQSWTGFQVAWTMARGYHGRLRPKCQRLVHLDPALPGVLVAPFIPWRRRPTLLHLDLLMLLGFSISLAFFNHAKIGISVPLVYPFLLYLLVRMLAAWAGQGRPAPNRCARSSRFPGWRSPIVFLMAFRIGLNVLNSNVIDVGYAGVIGADQADPRSSRSTATGRPTTPTATPTARSVLLLLRPVPADLRLERHLEPRCPPRTRRRSSSTRSRSGGLFLVGRRLKGNALGILLAYGWAAYPFTLFTLELQHERRARRRDGHVPRC